MLYFTAQVAEKYSTAKCYIHLHRWIWRQKLRKRNSRQKIRCAEFYNYWTTLKVCYFGLGIFAISDSFWAFHETQFWKSNFSRLGLEMVTYLLQPVTIVGSPLLLMDLAPLWGVALWGTASAPIMGWSSAHGKRHVYKRIRQSQILEEGSNTTFWILVIRGCPYIT